MGGGACEKLALIRLNFFACRRSDWLLRLIDLYGGAGPLLKRPARELAAAGGVMPETASRLAAQAAAADPEKELLEAERYGISVLTLGDAEYPQILRNIYDPPLVLYVRGSLAPMPAAAVVGTRKATPYGLRTAARLGREFAQRGVAVASGLARGVDTAAHRAAVDSGGITWAVLGTGLNAVYPPENRGLAESIVAAGGAVISEFPLETRGLPANFPRRNRIISGLSLATVVVEGGFESGALITARFALEQGREVLAVPGPVDSPASRGPNYYIKNGAFPAEGADDVVACFPAAALAAVKPAPRAAAVGPSGAVLGRLSPDAREAYSAIAAEEDGLNADGVTEKLGWPVQRTAAALFELEATALLASRKGRYCRLL